MEGKTYRHTIAVIATICLSVIIFLGTKSFPFSAIAFIGILFFYASGEAFIDYCKMRTPLFFANIGLKGHSSLIESDTFTIPSPYEEEPIYRVMMVGGSAVPYLPFHGFGPVFICPDEYVKRDFQGAYLAIADWVKVPFDSLPQLFQNALLTRLEHFNPKITEIYFADTSPINEVMKSDLYIDLALRCKNLEAEKNALSAQNEDLRVALKSTMNIVKEIKETKERENERPPKYRYVKVVE